MDDGTYCHHYSFRMHQSLGGVASSAEIVFQHGEGENPWCYAEECPGIGNGVNALCDTLNNEWDWHFGVVRKGESEKEKM